MWRRSEMAANPADLGSAADLRSPGAQIERESRRDAAEGEPPRKPELRPPQPLLAASLKDAALAALIAAALGLFFIGLKTEVAGTIYVRTRWDALAIAVAVVFLGRLLLNLFFLKRRRSASTKAWSVAPS